jgi:prepilin peptidase CpaA
MAIAHLLLLAMLASAAAWDLVRFRIPNSLSLTIAGLFLLVTAVAPAAALQPLGHLAVGGCAIVVGFLLFSMRVMGGGDAKLLAATALWMGPGLIGRHLLYTAVIGVAVMVLILGARQAWIMICLLAPERTSNLRIAMVLQPQQHIPYGIAISASAGYLSFSLPPSLWLF